jgi:molybdate transport system regulatory protein
MAAKFSPKRSLLKPRFRVVCGKDIALGPGKVELLAALVKTGSLSEAARQLEMSYMRAWKLANTMNEHFREPLVIAERGGKSGGGMKVTAAGRRALDLYRQIEKKSLQATQAQWKALQKILRG